MRPKHKNIKSNSSSALVSLRKFPYPFHAGVAICSDIDDCDRNTFIKLHRLLNIELKLPIADSFFGKKGWPWQMAYYENDCQTITADAEFLDQAIHDGLIDSLHTWGDFQETPPHPNQLRELACNITDRLINNGSKIKVWIHHGTSPNYQNITSRLAPYCGGDDPDSPYYTADYMQRLGIKFCWLCELVDWPLSNRLATLNSILLRRLAINSFKNLVKMAIGHKNRVRYASELKELCIPKQIRDGQTVLAFTRFFYHPNGRRHVASRLTFRHCLNSNVLDRLVAEESYLILYTHLAFPRQWDGNMFADMQVLEQLQKEGYLHLDKSSDSNANQLFSQPDWAALWDLSERYRHGKIWVATTSNMLTYWMVHRYLKWHIEQNNNNLTIIIDNLDDPTTGSRLPEETELAGLCFYSPVPDRTTILLGGKKLNTQVNLPDSIGRASLNLKLSQSPKLDLLKHADLR